MLKPGSRSLAETRLLDRLADKFTIGDGCWKWTAGTLRGYGQFWLNGSMRPAHRVIYELMVGSMPSGMVTDHLCRNRACVRPSHLEITTHAVNILRGTGQSARNAAKTHCRNGHEFTEDNIYWHRNWNGNMGRNCRTCVLARQKERYHRAQTQQ